MQSFSLKQREKTRRKHGGDRADGDASLMAQKAAKSEFQFAHLETYARRPAARSKGPDKHSVAAILGEAMRLPEHCPHVAHPGEPEVVEGLHPTELLARHDALVESRRIAGKRNKVDVHTLAAAVYSWPEMVEYTDRQRFYRFVQDVLAWHRKHVGPIDSAVIHWDETYPHLHVYTSDMDARRLSPGWRAKRAVLEAGGKARAANEAYQEAMRGWQDAFYLEVGQLNGLDRLGPKRQRLTRREHRDQKFERLAAGDRLRAARDAAAASEQVAEQARERASRAQMREQLIGARVSQLAAESQQAEVRLAELQTQAERLSADLAALPALRDADDRATILDAALQWIAHLGDQPEVRRVWDAVAAIRAGAPAAIEQARAVMIELRAELVAQQQAAEAELGAWSDGPT